MASYRSWGRPNKRQTTVRGRAIAGTKRVYPTGKSLLSKHPRLRRLGSNSP
jgi:hypothetical protein